MCYLKCSSPTVGGGGLWVVCACARARVCVGVRARVCVCVCVNTLPSHNYKLRGMIRTPPLPQPPY